MKLPTRFRAYMLVWQAERNYRQGGDCQVDQLTDIQVGQNAEQKNFDTLTRHINEYRRFLPHGWKIGYNTDKDTLGTAFKRPLEVYVISVFDPSRCSEAVNPAVSLTRRRAARRPPKRAP